MLSRHDSGLVELFESRLFLFSSIFEGFHLSRGLLCLDSGCFRKLGLLLGSCLSLESCLLLLFSESHKTSRLLLFKQGSCCFLFCSDARGFIGFLLSFGLFSRLRLHLPHVLGKRSFLFGCKSGRLGICSSLVSDALRSDGFLER